MFVKCWTCDCSKVTALNVFYHLMFAPPFNRGQFVNGPVWVMPSFNNFVFLNVCKILNLSSGLDCRVVLKNMRQLWADDVSKMSQHVQKCLYFMTINGITKRNAFKLVLTCLNFTTAFESPWEMHSNKYNHDLYWLCNLWNRLWI